jgi:hypothetical protein
MSELPESEMRTLVFTNAARPYRADQDLLQRVTDRIGPTVAEIATPLTPEEFPRDPNFVVAFPGTAASGISLAAGGVH